jgi:hypothetical protein
MSFHLRAASLETHLGLMRVPGSLYCAGKPKISKVSLLPCVHPQDHPAYNHPETMIMTGYCSCDSPTLEFAGNFIMQGVLEASKILEKVVCPALQAVDIVMTIGMAAIPPPGKAVTGGMGEAAIFLPFPVH